MPRQKLLRKIISPPHFKGFVPLGLPEHGNPVLLGFEEYEAIRLCDFDGYHQGEAARIMNVSRPTFARIYEDARRKVAMAFVLGTPIVFEGGKIYYDSDWYQCETCKCKFDQVNQMEPVQKCALCGSQNVRPVEQRVKQVQEGHLCVCPACGHEKTVTFGMPCSHVNCENCGARLRRRWR